MVQIIGICRAAGALMLAAALIGCAGQAGLTATPTATETGQGGAIPSTTAPRNIPRNTPTFVLPPPTGGIVGGPVEGGDAVTSQAVSPTQGSPEPPSVDSNGQVVLTLADHGKTITLKTGQTFLLKLDLSFYWTIDVGDDGVIIQVMTFAPIPDAQGMYSAAKPGRALISAVGDLPCRSETPPCMAPSRQFEVTIVVQ